MTLFQFLTYAVLVVCLFNLLRMAVFLIGADIYGVQQTLSKRKMKRSTLPTFSVVIPAHNEEETIVQAVKSVFASDYPRKKLQVIVVDDGSTDRTVELVRALYEDPLYDNLLVIEQANSGKAHALNYGMKNYASGDLVMCLDADSTVLPSSIRNAARYFRDKRVVALSSNVKIRPTGTLLNLIQQFEYIICYQMKRAHTVFNVEYIIGGIGSTFRRSALESVDFYDTDTITEDIDLTFKLLRAGNKENRVIYGSDVVTYTESVLSVKDLIKQRYRWKHGRSQTFLKNKELFFSRDSRHSKLLTWVYLPYALVSDLAFFFEPLIVAFILYIVIAFVDWPTIIGSLLVISAYIALNIFAEDTIPWRQRFRLALFAPLMYVLFYLLSYVEYVALLKSYARSHHLIKGTDTNCNWEHVARAQRI